MKEGLKFGLSGKVALITGSTCGIGKAIAEQMALHGAKVVVSSRKTAACGKVVDEINKMTKNRTGQAAAIPCNISNKDELQDLVKQTLQHFGLINILVCNAAINVYLGPMARISDEAFDKILDTNVKSNHWLCQMVLPGMVERREGVIIVISSIAGLHGSRSYLKKNLAPLCLATKLQAISGSI